MAKPDNTLKRKQREEKEKAEDGLKFVINGAKLKCDLCTVPEGDLKVNFDTPTIQDKKVATVVEKDKKSVIFKGNCKKSPNSSSPCASVMKLADWKDVGTVYFQEKFPLLLKSTIKCEYGGVAIKITDCAQRNEIKNLDVTGAPVPGYAPDFTIKFELDKTENTIVPFGILDFEKKIENQFFRFKYSLKESNIDAFYFEIISEGGDLLYENNWLKPVIINNETKEKLFKSKKTSHIPMVSAERPVGSPDLEPKNYTTMGSYIISWDGFDTNGIYDSTRFNGKDLKAKITAIKNGMQKSIVVDFSTKYSQVDWTDVKIDKKSKRIDVTLRVNLKDGGAKGLDCSTYTIDTEASYETFTPTTGVDPLAGTKITTCDWDKVPAKVINPSHPVIKSRTKTFDELKKMAFAGLEKYWGRNKNNIVGKNVNIVEAYEVYIKAIDTSKNALHSLPLVYNTNRDWMRSGNPGGSYSDGNLDDNFLNALPDLGVIQRLSYNAGHIKHDWKGDPHDGWRYHLENDVNTAYDAISSFKETAAHELGHELLQAYAGTVFSWQHKGSSYYLPQDTKPIKGSETISDKIFHLDEMSETSGEYYPKKGEIDLMKYYNNEPNPKDITRLVASERDVLSLIWLTKIKIK
ncbi:DUF4280 domain-containing protein [Flavobacterium araucananum]|uniref:DUF4280 domain-containing protein n=1 Tax=Flavobacterium araucananum TaxID=946678 RepID=A0A227P974_9FLAO|nr:DUF4280 domain-containing protein [Flavobacterium araucananum]OXG06459.1 hypothetical protein B0A64_10105 [Flavobacterium araucananum]